MTATAVGIAHVPHALQLSTMDTAEIPRIVFPCPARTAEELEAEVRRLSDLGCTLIEISDFLHITPDQAMTAGAHLRTEADAIAWHRSLPPLSDEEVRAQAGKWAAMGVDGLAATYRLPEVAARTVWETAVEALADLDARQVDQEYMDAVQAILDAPGTAQERLDRLAEFNAQFDWRGAPVIALSVDDAIRALRTSRVTTREGAAALLDTWGATWGNTVSLDRARVLAKFPPANGPTWSVDVWRAEQGGEVHQSLCSTVDGVDHTTGDPAECAGVYLYLEGTTREAYAVVGVHDVWGESDLRLDAPTLRQLAAHAAALADQLDGGQR